MHELKQLEPLYKPHFNEIDLAISDATGKVEDTVDEDGMCCKIMKR